MRVPDGHATWQELIAALQDYGECLYCGRKKRSHRFNGCCCSKCEWRHKNRQSGTEFVPETIPCAACGKKFTQGYPGSRFCTNECANIGIVPHISTYTIFERDFFRCVYCGKSSVEDGVKLHADHIVPRSRGGLDRATNMVTACSACNLSKNDRPHKRSVLLRVQRLVAYRCHQSRVSPNALVD